MTTIQATSPTGAGLRCCGCGYDLHVHGLHTQCPECGCDVRLSFWGGQLQIMPVSWLKTVRRGTLLFMWAGRLGMLHSLVFMIFIGFALITQALDAYLIFQFWLVGVGGLSIVAGIASAMIAWPTWIDHPPRTPREELVHGATRWGLGVCALALCTVCLQWVHPILGRAATVWLMLLTIPALPWCAMLTLRHLATIVKRSPRDHVGTDLACMLHGLGDGLKALAISAAVLEVLFLVLSGTGAGFWIAALALPFGLAGLWPLSILCRSLRDASSELSYALRTHQSR